MAGLYGSQSVTIAYDDSAGGTARTITGYVMTSSGVKISSAMQASHAFGDSWEEYTPSGLMKMEPVTMHGHWDTTETSGPHAVFYVPDDGPQDSTRTLTIVFGDSKTMAVETRLVSFEVLGINSQLTEFEAVIQPTGTAQWS